MGVPKNLVIHPLPDHVSHFGAPWRIFWIFEVLLEGVGVLGYKHLFSKSCWERPNT